MKVEAHRCPMPRRKLDRVNTVEDVCGLLQNSKKIVVLTGAGAARVSSLLPGRSLDSASHRMAVERMYFDHAVKSCTIYSDAGGTILGAANKVQASARPAGSPTFGPLAQDYTISLQQQKWMIFLNRKSCASVIRASSRARRDCTQLNSTHVVWTFLSAALTYTFSVKTLPFFIAWRRCCIAAMGESGLLGRTISLRCWKNESPC